MLLTSSQVSVALSSLIIILFTAALFGSGYAIQQRTLRDLRRAIKPEPREKPKQPKIFLPDRFKKATTELEDGTVIELDEEEAAALAAGAGHGANSHGSKGRKQGGTVVEVRPTIPEDDRTSQKAMKNSQKPKDDSKGKKGKKSSGPEKPLSRYERRKKIKEEIQELSQGETPIYYQRRLW